MAFTEDEIRNAWDRSQGKCECRRRNHHHSTLRCGAPLLWDRREMDGIPGSWYITPCVPGGPQTKSNCEILCQECYDRKNES